MAGRSGKADTDEGGASQQMLSSVSLSLMSRLSSELDRAGAPLDALAGS